MEFVLVGTGGVLGAVARHLVGERVDANTRDTLTVNVLGSVLLGALVAAPVAESLLLLAGVGFCGAFTTFSSFAFETVRLAETGEPKRALANAVVNLVGTILAVFAGFAAAGLVL
ncbi:fluoride efflux transporter FluC [Salinibaculum rarum]|uniref:fluoride efflux transporter FluC n=1 Tax=Salinibaculum rarum TaxID=3058903 RepID=UPI00265E8256|nr:CrcB family protein [Salinibaculum sp. KK48]